MTTTTNLGITLLEQAQAQKEVTINEAFTAFDALINGSVADKDLTLPPASPTTGVAYLVAAGATGAWAGKATNIAYFNQTWRFIAPQTGARVWVMDEGAFYTFNGTAWVIQLAGGDMLKSTYDAANIAQQVVGTSAAQTLSNKTISGASNTLTVRAASDITGTLPVANGGTGAATAQAAINALTGTQTAGRYLRSDGTNASLAAIQAADVPTLNQNTTGSAASFTGALAGDVTGTQGATVVGKINGTSLAGLATGILKNTTTTGVPSIAVAADFPVLNQSTTGNAATATALQTARTINGVSFDGSANITVPAAAGTLTGTTLAAGIVSSSLTSVGTIATGTWQGTAIADAYIASAAAWNAKQGALTLTTTGTSGAATLVGNTLNIPSYAGGGSSAFSGLTGGTNTAAAMLVGTGASLAATGTGTIVATSTSGNAATATTLQTARLINGVSFNGSADITVTAAAGTLSGTTLNATVTGSSLTSVGTIATGTWQGTAIAGQFGGTGVNNAGKTITLGGNLTTSGAFATTLTATAATNVTLPTTGTLATLAGSETLTNKTLTTPTLTTPVVNGNTSGTGLVLPADGRLTLTTGVPVTTSDVTAATSIFYTPYRGNKIALYTGSTWFNYTFTQMTLALGTLVAARPYDVFIDYNAGSPILVLLAWTNDTTRATALAYQDGVLVKSGTATQRYLGTFYTTSTTTTEDSAANRYVWNYYNRIARPMLKLEATASWTYSVATTRQANGSTANQLNFVLGVSEDAVTASVLGRVTNSTATARTCGVFVSLDSTTNVTAPYYFSFATNAAYTPVSQGNFFSAAAGRHFISWNEQGAGTDVQTWIGGSASGLSGQLLG